MQKPGALFVPNAAGLVW